LGFLHDPPRSLPSTTADARQHWQGFDCGRGCAEWILKSGASGQNLGEYLLLDALARSVKASKTIGSAVVVVDAKDAKGAAFYAQYGVVPFTSEPSRLFMAMKTIAMLTLRPRG